MLLLDMIDDAISALKIYAKFEKILHEQIVKEKIYSEAPHFGAMLLLLAARHKLLSTILYPALAMRKKDVLRKVKVIICTLTGRMKIASGLSIWTSWLDVHNRTQLFLLDEGHNSSSISVGAAAKNSCALIVAADSTQDCMNRHESVTNTRTESQLNALDPNGPSNPEGHRRGVAKPLLCLLYTSPSPRDLSTSRMPSSA